MKLNWVKVLILCASAAAVLAATSELEVRKLGQSLDELVSQRTGNADEVIKNGKKKKVQVAPVELDRIVPIVARMLKIDQKPVRELLEGDKEKLSRIFYARLIAEKTDRKWLEVLKEQTVDPLEQVKRAGVSLDQVHERMEDLYTELSFAALDSPLEPKSDPKSPKGESSKK